MRYYGYDNIINKNFLQNIIQERLQYKYNNTDFKQFINKMMSIDDNDNDMKNINISPYIYYNNYGYFSFNKQNSILNQLQLSYKNNIQIPNDMKIIIKAKHGFYTEIPHQQIIETFKEVYGDSSIREELKNLKFIILKILEFHYIHNKIKKNYDIDINSVKLYSVDIY